MYQKIVTVRLCGHCGSNLIDHRGDYPSCRICGWEDYQRPRISVVRAHLAATIAVFNAGPVREKRFCTDCGADISHRHERAAVCLRCRYRKDSMSKVRTA